MNEWICVKDRLPNDDVRVLVYLGLGNYYTKIDTDRRVKGKWVRWGENVTYWMPLPEPPTKDMELTPISSNRMLSVGGEYFSKEEKAEWGFYSLCDRCRS